MKRLPAFVLICSMLPVLSAQQLRSVQSHDSSDTGFATIADRWVSAYNGTDAKLLEPLYTEDAQYISGHVPGLVANGRTNLIANFQNGMNMGGHLDGLDILSFSRSCDLATVLCEYRANNGGQKATGRTLLLMKRVDGRWRIYVHMTVV